MNKIIYWILIVWLSLKWVFRITLGDWVLYEGKKYQVINGVCLTTWKIQEVLYGPTFEAPRVDIIKIWSLSGMVSSFKSGYSFYMTSWYSIWVNEGIKPWMRNCKIW